MSRMKDAWLGEFERIAGELEDAGMHPDAAYDRAADLAGDALADRLADMADRARDLSKERF